MANNTDKRAEIQICVLSINQVSSYSRQTVQPLGVAANSLNTELIQSAAATNFNCK